MIPVPFTEFAFTEGAMADAVTLRILLTFRQLEPTLELRLWKQRRSGQFVPASHIIELSPRALVEFSDAFARAVAQLRANGMLPAASPQSVKDEGRPSRLVRRDAETNEARERALQLRAAGKKPAEIAAALKGRASRATVYRWLMAAPAAAPESAADPAGRPDGAVPALSTHGGLTAPGTRATRLPIAELPEEWRAYCLKERPDLDASAVWQNFRDYFAAAPDRTGLKRDWLATWRKWVRGERSARGAPSGGSWWASEAAIEAKGGELGLRALPGESWSGFKARISQEIDRRRAAGAAAAAPELDLTS